MNSLNNSPRRHNDSLDSEDMDHLIFEERKEDYPELFTLPDEINPPNEINTKDSLNILEEEKQEEKISEIVATKITIENQVPFSNIQSIFDSTNEWAEVSQSPFMRPVVIKSPKLKALEYSTPFEIFNSLIGNPLWSLLTSKTNEYAESCLNEETTASHLETHPFSRLHRWEPTNTQEIMKFVAMMLSMALSKRNDIRGNILTILILILFRSLGKQSLFSLTIQQFDAPEKIPIT